MYCKNCGHPQVQENNKDVFSKINLDTDSDIKYDSVNGGFYIQPLNVDIYLGGEENFMLDENEYCLFVKEDVAWYEINPRYNALDCDACGTLYLTNKCLYLYDEGFSNFWTRLSKEGDYPKQVKRMPINEIVDIVSKQYGNFTGPYIQGTGFGCWLPPSERRYTNRKSPIVSRYDDMDGMVGVIFLLQNMEEKGILSEKMR